MDFTLTFISVFFTLIGLAAPLLIFLLSLIVICGQLAGRREGWAPMSALYWTFITATTVGYGDLRPTERRSRILSVFIALVGLLLTGIIVALALNAATYAFKEHMSEDEVMQHIEEHLD